MIIFLVTSSFPPYSDSQTIRFTQWMQGLSAENIEWHLFVPGEMTDGAGQFAKYLPKRCTIHRTGVPTVLKLLKRMSSNSLRSWILNNLSYYFSFPDRFSGFDESAFQLMACVSANIKADVIISSSGSPTAHLAALKFKKKFHCSWIADFGDPWSVIEKRFKPWFYLWAKKAESKIISSADRVLFTTQETERVYRSIYPSLRSHVLPYGYIASDFENISESTSEVINIAHIGAAFVGDRNLIPSIQAISSVSNSYCLSVIGNHSDKFQLEAKVCGLKAEFRSRVDFESSLEMMKGSDVLLLVGNKGGLQVPGKVFHYLASLKIILYIYQRNPETDPAYRILNQFPSVKFAPNNSSEILVKLQEIKEQLAHLSAEAKTRKNMGELRRFESANLGKQMLEIIRNDGVS